MPINTIRLRGLTTVPNRDEPNDDTANKRRTFRPRATEIVDFSKSQLQKYLSLRATGWRFAAINFAICAFVVFLINLIVTICSLVSNEGVFFEGNCERVKTVNTGVHVLINVLSTALLSGSNYCMQCLSAPTRREVDRAHIQKKWLDTGVPSIRNLRHIRRRRLMLWFLLAFTSLPLHLFYNSAVFGSISSNDYYVFSVSQSFLNDSECYNCPNDDDPDRIFDHLVLKTLHKRARDGNLDGLEPVDCINQYAQFIQSNRRNVLLVASDHWFPTPEENHCLNGSRVYWSNSFSAGGIVYGPNRAADVYSWMCSGVTGLLGPNDLDSGNQCSNVIDQFKSAPETWHMKNICIYSDKNKNCTEYSWPVEYCLSEKAEPHCKLQFSRDIAILVIGLNFLKAGLIISVIALGSLMVISIIGFGFIPYKRGMPRAGSCSMAISAACHVDDQDRDDESPLAEQKLQWGAVSNSSDAVGHCAFLSHGLSYQ